MTSSPLPLLLSTVNILTESDKSVSGLCFCKDHIWVCDCDSRFWKIIFIIDGNKLILYNDSSLRTPRWVGTLQFHFSPSASSCAPSDSCRYSSTGCCSPFVSRASSAPHPTRVPLLPLMPLSRQWMRTPTRASTRVPPLRPRLRSPVHRRSPSPSLLCSARSSSCSSSKSAHTCSPMWAVVAWRSLPFSRPHSRQLLAYAVLITYILRNLAYTNVHFDFAILQVHFRPARNYRQRSQFCSRVQYTVAPAWPLAIHFAKPSKFMSFLIWFVSRSCDPDLIYHLGESFEDYALLLYRIINIL